MALSSFEAQLPVAAGICLNAYSLWTRVWHGGMICLAVAIPLDILTFASSFGSTNGPFLSERDMFSD